MTEPLQTTSKRFYDVTAHGTIEKIIADFDGKYIGGLSADMEDLTSKSGQKELVEWWQYVHYQVENGLYERQVITKKCNNLYINCQQMQCNKHDNKNILVVTDSSGNESLDNMISDFCALMPYRVELFNVNDFHFKCGCLGCLKCTQSGVCAVNDGFSDLLNNKINKADAVITAFTITNHALSSQYKMFFDRQFVNGHRPVTAGKPTGYIVSGNLSNENILIEYIDAKSAVGGNLNCGIVCDENNTLEDIQSLVKRLTYALENNLSPEHNFYEIGGMKIFRDMIWIMRGLMKEDYKFYKKNNLLDFPQKKKSTMILMCLLGKLLSSKSINKKMPNMLSDGMLMPYQNVIDKATPLDTKINNK